MPYNTFEIGVFVICHRTGRYLVLSSGTLMVANVSQSDAGTYQCIAYNPVVGSRVRSPLAHRLQVVGEFPIWFCGLLCQPLYYCPPNSGEMSNLPTDLSTATYYISVKSVEGFTHLTYSCMKVFMGT